MSERYQNQSELSRRTVVAAGAATALAATVVGGAGSAQAATKAAAGLKVGAGTADHVTYEAVDGFYIQGTAEKAATRIGRIIKSLN